LALRAKLHFDRGCVKSLLPPAAAEYYFERHVILTISLREIVKMTCLSKHNSARSAVKNLFTQPQTLIWREAPKKDFLHNPRTSEKRQTQKKYCVSETCWVV
jgi:hypothetical protein